MKLKRNIFLAAMCILLISADAFAEPVAFLPEKTHVFEPVIEGTEITHDFILQNKGIAPLDILNLKSG